MDPSVVPAQRKVPDYVSRRAVQLRDDLAATAATMWTPPGRHIRVLIAVGQVIGDPRHNRAEEDRQAENAFRNRRWQVTGFLVEVMTDSTTQPPVGFRTGLAVMTMVIASRRTLSRSGIPESDAARELAIRATPRRASAPGLCRGSVC